MRMMGYLLYENMRYFPELNATLMTVSKRTKELDFDIEFSDKAVEEIGKAGFDPVYGARPLRRAIQQQIEDKLSEEMLEGKLTPGKRYLCDHGENGFEFIEQE